MRSKASFCFLNILSAVEVNALTNKKCNFVTIFFVKE